MYLSREKNIKKNEKEGKKIKWKNIHGCLFRNNELGEFSILFANEKV
jgi:hypothetical protein